MNIIKAITYNDQWELVSQLGFLGQIKQNKSIENNSKLIKFKYNIISSLFRIFNLLQVKIIHFYTLTDLEEILHTFRVIAVALPAYTFHFLNLPCFAGRLNVLEMNIWILAKVHNRPQEVEQTCIITIYIYDTKSWFWLSDQEKSLDYISEKFTGLAHFGF